MGKIEQQLLGVKETSTELNDRYMREYKTAKELGGETHSEKVERKKRELQQSREYRDGGGHVVELVNTSKDIPRAMTMLHFRVKRYRVTVAVSDMVIHDLGEQICIDREKERFERMPLDRLKASLTLGN